VPATLALTLPALALKLGIGIPAGIYAALHRNSMADRLVMAAWRSRASPCRVLRAGLLLVLVFAVQLGWLPAAGRTAWRHAILPVVTLGIGGAAIMARFTRRRCSKCWANPISAPPRPRA
jgi:peptide/nickel transport system permease protein